KKHFPFSINKDFPVRIKAIVQKQDRRRGCGGLKLNSFGLVTGDFHGTGGGIGRAARRGGKVVGDEDAFRRVEPRTPESLEGGGVIGVDLPLGEELRARQGAGEFEEGVRTVGRGQRGQMLPFGWL